MGKILTTFLLAMFAYKLGEQTAQLKAHDYFISRKTILSGGQVLEEYVIILPTGQIDYGPQGTATPLTYWQAKELKNILRSYSPEQTLSLEIANVQLLN